MNFSKLLPVFALMCSLALAADLQAQESINTDRPGVSFSSTTLNNNGLVFQLGSGISNTNSIGGKSTNLASDFQLRFALINRIELNLGYTYSFQSLGVFSDLRMHMPMAGIRGQLFESSSFGSMALVYWFELPFTVRESGDQQNVISESFHQFFLAYNIGLSENFSFSSTLKSNLYTRELGITANGSFDWDVFGAFGEVALMLNDAQGALYTSSWAGDTFNTGLFVDVSSRFRADIFIVQPFQGGNPSFNFGISAALK